MLHSRAWRGKAQMRRDRLYRCIFVEEARPMSVPTNSAEHYCRKHQESEPSARLASVLTNWKRLAAAAEPRAALPKGAAEPRAAKKSPSDCRD